MPVCRKRITYYSGTESETLSTFYYCSNLHKNQRVRKHVDFYAGEKMQREISTAGRGGAFSYDNGLPSPSVLSKPTAFDLTSLYSSMLFPPTGQLLDDSQPSRETTVTPVLTPRFRQNHSSQLLIDLHYQQALMDRHNRVLSQLLETEKKTLALRQENINLKMANFNLNNRLSLMLKASSDYGPSSGLGLDNGLQSMHVGVGHEEETSSDGHSW